MSYPAGGGMNAAARVRREKVRIQAATMFERFFLAIDDKTGDVTFGKRRLTVRLPPRHARFASAHQPGNQARRSGRSISPAATVEIR